MGILHTILSKYYFLQESNQKCLEINEYLYTESNRPHCMTLICQWAIYLGPVTQVFSC